MFLARALVVVGAAAAVVAAAAQLGPVPYSGGGQRVGPVEQLKEASGLAMSRLHKDIVYTHNDEGAAVLYAVNSTNGQVVAKLAVLGAINHDWEDVAVGPCGADSCVYIADTGDKNLNSARNVIYRAKESPTMSALSVDEMASFKWEYEDCETLMVDPKGAVWLVPKVKGSAQLFKIGPKHFGGPKVNLAGTGSPVKIDLGGKRGPTAGDIARDGSQILLRTEAAVWHYQMQSGEADIRAALTRSPRQLPVEDEPYGEAVCWNAAADGYYTLSEGSMQPLYFYRYSVPSSTIVG